MQRKKTILSGVQGELSTGSTVPPKVILERNDTISQNELCVT